MQIGIIGAGKIGSTAAKLFLAAGHEVTLSNSRNPRSLESLVKELGEGVRAAAPEQAAEAGEVVLVAIPFKAIPSLGSLPLGGKVVIDATNYYPERDGSIDFKGRASSEVFALHAGRNAARVVKAFNTMWFKTLASEGKPGAPLEQRLALFLAGDDAQAKATVSKLIESIGFAPVDTGSLHEGGLLQEPDSRIYNKPLRLADARGAVASGGKG